MINCQLNRCSGYSDLIGCNEILFLRHPHPKVFQKIRNTKEMIKSGFHPSEFEERGGLNLKNYNKFLSVIRSRHQALNYNFKKIQFQGSYSRSKSIVSKKRLKTNNKNVLVLLVDFKDNKSITSKETFEDLLFSRNKISQGSLRDYFQEVSWGELDVVGDVLGWYQVSKKYSGYVDSGIINKNSMKWKMDRARRLAKEALELVRDSRSVKDFSKYDVNDDGKLDVLIIIYAGKGAERTGDFSKIFPHRGFFSKPVRLQDNVIADNYIMMHELPSYDIGGLCHEFAHSLGVPDFYYPDHSSSVLGSWCLMGLGCFNNDGKTPAHLNPWSKGHLGWVKPEKIHDNKLVYDIPEVIDPSKKVYKLEIQGTGGKEYFLVENRQQKKFDAFLPGSGLLIWHVNENFLHGNFPNLNPSHLFLTLEQADGKKSLEARTVKFGSNQPYISEEDNVGGSGDVFPGKTNNRTFDSRSKPNSNSYRGYKSHVSISQISNSDDLMTAQMRNK